MANAKSGSGGTLTGPPTVAGQLHIAERSPTVRLLGGPGVLLTGLYVYF